MIPYHPHSSKRAFGHQAHVLLTAGDYGQLSGHRIAAQDHARSWAARAEQDRRMAEAGMRTRGFTPFFASLRYATGVALIRIGERLRGAPVVPAAPAEAPLA